MKLLSLYSPIELALHYFSSNLFGEQQLDVAYAAIEGVPDAVAQWILILGAMRSLDWPVFAEDVENTHVQQYGIVPLVGHLWNSNLSYELAESVLNAAHEIVDGEEETWALWLQVKGMAELKYAEWEVEQLRQKVA